MRPLQLHHCSEQSPTVTTNLSSTSQYAFRSYLQEEASRKSFILPKNAWEWMYSQTLMWRTKIPTLLDVAFTKVSPVSVQRQKFKSPCDAVFATWLNVCKVLNLTRSQLSHLQNGNDNISVNELLRWNEILYIYIYMWNIWLCLASRKGPTRGSCYHCFC